MNFKHVDFREIELLDDVYVSKEVKISRGICSKHDKVICFCFPQMAVLTKEMLRFLELLCVYNGIACANLMNVYGISADISHYALLFEDNDYSSVDIENISENEREKLVNDVVFAVMVLHSHGISHNMIKSYSVFKDQSGRYILGMICPQTMIPLEKEDFGLPFYSSTILKNDIFMLGCFIIRVFYQIDQTNLLNTLWSFGELFTEPSFYSDIALQCITHKLDTRYTAQQVYQIISNRIPSCPTECQYVQSEVSVDEKTVFGFLNNSHVDDSFLTIKGVCLCNGYGCERDFSQARAFFEKRSSVGDPIAMNNLAKLIQDQNLNESIRLYQQAADFGYCISQKNVSLLLRNANNINGCVKYLQMAADQGYHEAICLFADLMRHANPKMSFQYMEMAAHQGDVSAMHMLGLYYEHGIGVESDYQQMVNYWSVGVEMGSYVTMNNLGSHSGSEETSYKLWTISAAKDIPEAQFNLANSYIFGRGCEKDPVKGAYWMEKAAQNGFINAMFDWANMLHEGLGVEANEIEAEKWCAKASHHRIQKELSDKKAIEESFIIRESLNI